MTATEMPTSTQESPAPAPASAVSVRTPLAKAVVVHAGARDSYQLALALSEAGLLETLVTDLLWPTDRSWSRAALSRLSPALQEMLQRRSVPGLPSAQVHQCVLAGLRVLFLDKLPRIPLSLRRNSSRAADAELGRTAGRLARRANAGLVTYSYYGYDAIREYARPAMLFQLHPHPATMRRLLRQELQDHPDCASSLQQEWELALPEQDFQHLVAETRMAGYYLAASTFTRDSLIEHGTPSSAITVVPYGVDSLRFHPAPLRTRNHELQLLFVGRINQRKGIKYLLEALRLLNTKAVKLTICGRVVDDLSLFRPFSDQVDIRPSVSGDELVAAYQAADLFCFPSVAEGFGQVLLESLSCGLPILSTTHTAAPDLIVEGREGFIVEPRRPDLLAARIAWALDHRSELEAMRGAARSRAEYFNWARFRSQAANAVQHYLASAQAE